MVSSLLVVCGSLWMSASDPDFAFGRNAQILFNMFRELYVYYVDEVDPDKMLKDAAKGMVTNLDPYTELIPENELETFEILTTGKYGGIGSLVRKSGDYVIIAQPYKGFPADKAGLVIGDKLLEVDGKNMKGAEVTDVSAMLKGEPGSKLRLKVEKFISGEVQELTLNRERIAISGVPYYGMLSDSVGYIMHDDFTEGCSEDFRKALLELKKQGATSLIYDLRGNGGGILQEAVKIVSFFVPKGTEVVSMRGRMRQMDKTYKTETEPVDLNIPVAVLTSGSSASAAEIVAGALQDLDRAVVVGQRSFGKGLVQSPRPVGFNAYLKVTTAKYYTPSGRCIQAIDYARHNEDGSVEHIPDSLIREYTTAAGRKVYDGAGIMPDSVIPPSYVSRFAMVLYAKGYIEDFANMYYKSHPVPVDVDGFRIDDAEYARFVEFMADKDVEYESQTKALINDLRQKAQREGYLASIEDQIGVMEEKIKADKSKDLALFRKDIETILEDEIVLRYHYLQGVARRKSLDDEEVAAAAELLGDRAMYRYILSEQDTKRK